MSQVPQHILNKRKKEKEKNVLEEAEKNGTFQIQSGEEQDMLKLKQAGFDDAAIQETILERRKILNSTSTGEGTKLHTESSNEKSETTEFVDVFEGKTKQEILKLAFQSGITKKSALEDIGDVYDMVTGKGDMSEEQIKQEDFAKAQQFIMDNPEASKEELLVAIRQHTNLDVSDVNALIGEAGILSREDTPGLTDDNLRTIARELVKKNVGLLGNSDEGIAKAKQQIEMGKIKISGKEATLSRSQIDAIKQLMDEEYPEGRSLLSRLLPGGK